MSETTINKDIKTWIHSLCGIISIIIALILLAGCIQSFLFGTNAKSIFNISNNWLIKIFGLLSGRINYELHPLHGINPLDILIVFLFGLTYVGLMYLSLRYKAVKNYFIWPVIVITQQFTGIIMYLITSSAGRTSFIGGIFILSIALLYSGIFKRIIPILGIIAGLFLGIGDITISRIPPLLQPVTTAAYIFGTGYILSILWFSIIGYKCISYGKG